MRFLKRCTLAPRILITLEFSFFAFAITPHIIAEKSTTINSFILPLIFRTFFHTILTALATQVLFSEVVMPEILLKVIFFLTILAVGIILLLLVVPATPIGVLRAVIMHSRRPRVLLHSLHGIAEEVSACIIFVPTTLWTLLRKPLGDPRSS